MRITCGTGPTVARRGSRIFCSCAGATTGLFTRKDSGSSYRVMARPVSSGPTAVRFLTPRRSHAGPEPRSNRLAHIWMTPASPSARTRRPPTGMVNGSTWTGPSESSTRRQPTRRAATFPRALRQAKPCSSHDTAGQTHSSVGLTLWRNRPSQRSPHAPVRADNAGHMSRYSRSAVLSTRDLTAVCLLRPTRKRVWVVGMWKSRLLARFPSP